MCHFYRKHSSLQDLDKGIIYVDISGIQISKTLEFIGGHVGARYVLNYAVSYQP